MCYSRDGDQIVVIASYGGAPHNPPWYYNLVANPIVTVEVGTDKFKARAAQVSGSERARLFDAAGKLLPLFADYQTRPSGKFPSSRCRASIEFGLYERLPLTCPFLSTALCVECRDWNSF